MAAQRSELTGIGLAALCGRDGIAHGSQLRVEGLRMQCGAAKAQQADENSGKVGGISHEVMIPKHA